MRRLILALLLLASCGGPPALPSYPRMVAGYTLGTQQVLSGAQVPKYVPTAGIERAVTLTYNASNGIQVVVFETTGSSVAFEALQNWRAHDDKLAVHHGRYFLVAQSEKPDPVALNAFLTAFERQLP